MSKKIIVIITVVTIVFVCSFAACKKEEGIYANEKEFDFVTDENGEKVLADDGQLIVYATDENGKHIVNKDGEKETVIQQFQPLENDGVVEDYGFKVTLPDGWKVEDTDFGKFINKSKKQACEISVVKYFYADYYAMNKTFYDKLLETENEVKWEDDVELGKDFGNACRFTMKSDGNISVMYFFRNSKNVYKILFTGTDSDSFVADTEAFCKSIEFKNFRYYDDVTSVSEKSE